MSAPIDIPYLVFNSILTTFPTSEVESNLDITSHLYNDLGLDSNDVYYLGLVIEKETPDFHFRFTDGQIMNWKTVNDIINTISSMLNQ